MLWFTMQKLKSKNPVQRVEAIRELAQSGKTDEIIEMLADESPRVLVAAVQSLGKLRDPRSIEPLVKLLGNEDTTVRKTVVEVLGEIKDPAGIPGIVSAFQDVEIDVRKAAIISAVTMAADSVPHLIPLLDSENDELRRSAIEALVKIHSASVMPVMAQLFETSPRLRTSAVEILSQIKDKRSITPFVELLADSDATVRQNAVSALQKMDWRPTNQRDMAYALIGVGKFSDAAQIGIEAITPLSSVLKTNDNEMRKSIAMALGRINDVRALHPLVELMRDPAADMRATAARILAQRGWMPDSKDDKILCYIALGKFDEAAKFGQDAIEPLSSSLADVDPVRRANAATALGMIPDNNAAQILTGALYDAVPDVRSAAARAMGKIGDADTVGMLLSVMDDENADVRIAIIEALGDIGDARASERLSLILRTSEEKERGAAATSLGAIGDENAIHSLIDALSDKSQMVKDAAKAAITLLDETAATTIVASFENSTDDSKELVDAIKSMGDHAVPLLVKAMRMCHGKGRRTVASLLGDLGWAPETAEDRAIFAVIRGDIQTAVAEGVAAFEAIASALTDPEPEVKTMAITALGALGDVRAVELLKKVVHDQNQGVRQAALKAMVVLVDEENVLEMMRGFLKDKMGYVRKEAATILGEMRDPKSVGSLVASLRDDVDEVRLSVVEALGKIGDQRAVIPLMSQYKDMDYQVRTSVAIALGELGDKRAIDTLLKMLGDDPYHDVREAAANSLGKLEDIVEKE
ncbi:MAG: HEAT repeat domain-containing protein [bacterium]